MRNWITNIKKILASTWFSVFTIVFFIFESVWIALSAVYPQAFDENFHFGIIKLYSHHWLPFLSTQSPDSYQYGAVSRDPSYLYHYLMSFPYRLIELFVHGQTGQVILLRFINIGLFALAIYLFFKILNKVGISKALANVIIFIFVLIPIAPILAGQINYDNLIILLVAWVSLVSFKMIDEIKAKKLSPVSLIYLITLCIASSLVKYEFFPIFLGVIIFFVFFIKKNFTLNLKKLLVAYWHDWQTVKLPIKFFCIGLLIVFSGLFIQRDGIDLVKYHTFAPNCSKVLSIKDCSAYSVWDSDYTRHQSLINANIHYLNPVKYLFSWIYWMWYRLFFAVNGPYSSFTNYPPLPLPTFAAGLIFLLAIYAVIKWRRRIFNKNPYLILLGVISSLFIISLIFEGYVYYRYTDTLELMNGRYLLPVLFFIAAIIGIAFSLELRKYANRKIIICILAMVFFLQGGGILTFIVRSDSSWYWPNNTVNKVNSTAKKLTNHVIVKGNSTYESRNWFFN